MRDVSRQPVLQINNSYEPMEFRSVRDAMRLVVKGKARVIEEYDLQLRKGYPLPAVIRLTEYARVPHKLQQLSRKNVLLRDRYVCQYCAKKFHPSELTLDHVIPQSKGGKDTWDNLVTACSPCNRRKADKSLEESGMMLLRKPRPSSIHTARYLLRCMGADDEKWKPYLFYGETEHPNVTRGVA